jgi:hypothetical protein
MIRRTPVRFQQAAVLFYWAFRGRGLFCGFGDAHRTAAGTGTVFAEAQRCRRSNGRRDAKTVPVPA